MQGQKGGAPVQEKERGLEIDIHSTAVLAAFEPSSGL